MDFVLVEFAVEDNTKLLYILKYLHIFYKTIAITILHKMINCDNLAIKVGVTLIDSLSF